LKYLIGTDDLGTEHFWSVFVELAFLNLIFSSSHDGDNRKQKERATVRSGREQNTAKRRASSEVDGGGPRSVDADSGNRPGSEKPILP